MNKGVSEVSPSNAENVTELQFDFSNHCRTCLRGFTDDNYYLFDEPMYRILEASTGVAANSKENESQDRIPNKICNMCLKALQFANAFREECQRVDTLLKSYVKDTVHSKTSSTIVIESDSEEVYSQTLVDHSDTIEETMEEEDDGSLLIESLASEQNPQKNPSYCLKRRMVCRRGKRHACPLCRNTYTRKYSLEKHLRLHHGGSRFECGHCHNDFHTFNALKLHIQNKENPCSLEDAWATVEESYTVVTVQCEPEFDSEQVNERVDVPIVKNEPLEDTIKTVNGMLGDEASVKKGNSCIHNSEESPAKQIDSDEMVNGIQQDTPAANEVPEFQPNNVDMNWQNSNDELRTTFRTRSLSIKSELLEVLDPPKDGNYADYQSDLANPSTVLVDKPTSNPIEDNEPSFSCFICGKKFQLYRDIIDHYASDHGKGPSSYQCAFCNVDLVNKFNLRNHLKVHISQEYKCQYCTIQYKAAYLLRRHLMSHTGVRPFHCRQCNKSFKGRYALKRHIQTHKTSNDYTCGECHKKFLTYNSLQLHFRSHKRITKIQCPRCKKQFRTNFAFRRHEEICSTKLKFTKSLRNRRVLLHQGFEYLVHYNKNGVVNWRCRLRSKCRAVIKTKDGKIHIGPTEHCHEPQTIYDLTKEK